MNSSTENLFALATQLVPMLQHNQQGALIALVALCVCLLARK